MFLKISFFLFLLSGFSCCPKHCIIDKQFINNFNKELQVIKSLQEKRKDTISPEEYGMALAYLSNITGFLPRADYSSTLGYRNKRYYIEDMKRLHEWLKNNKCGFTNTKADSLLRAAGYRF
jgi:hypothetical protein